MIGSFRSVNVTIKMNAHNFSNVAARLLQKSQVGESSRSWIPRDRTQIKKEKEIWLLSHVILRDLTVRRWRRQWKPSVTELTDFGSFQTFSRLFQHVQTFQSWSGEEWTTSELKWILALFAVHVLQRSSNLVILCCSLYNFCFCDVPVAVTVVVL